MDYYLFHLLRYTSFKHRTKKFLVIVLQKSLYPSFKLYESTFLLFIAYKPDRYPDSRKYGSVAPWILGESVSLIPSQSFYLYARGARGEGGKEKNEENIVPYRPLCCVSAKDDWKRVRKSVISTLDCVKVSLPRTVGWFCIYYGPNTECCNPIKTQNNLLSIK